MKGSLRCRASEGLNPKIVKFCLIDTKLFFNLDAQFYLRIALSVKLLWRCVQMRPERQSAVRLLQRARQAEVSQLHQHPVLILLHKHVTWLHVVVDDAPRMYVV